MIRIQVPATSANLGSGFDSLGIALTLYNQVWMEEEDGIFISSRDGLDVPTGEDNLIYWAAKQLYDECGARLPGLRIEQQSDIPMTRGLGSSSACIVAGLLGADRLLGGFHLLLGELPQSRGNIRVMNKVVIRKPALRGYSAEVRDVLLDLAL